MNKDYLKNRRRVYIITEVGNYLSLKNITEAIQKIPEEDRDSVSIQADEFMDYGSSYRTITLNYQRFETEEEYSARLVQEEEVRQWRFKQYENLKKEFENE